MTHPIQHYFALFDEPDDTTRRTRLGDIVATDITYIDEHAPTVITGIDELNNFITTFRARLPHLRFTPDGTTNTAHHAFRHTWTLVHHANNAPFSTGTTTGLLNDDQRITLIVAFLDNAPGTANEAASR